MARDSGRPHHLLFQHHLTPSQTLGYSSGYCSSGHNRHSDHSGPSLYLSPFFPFRRNLPFPSLLIYFINYYLPSLSIVPSLPFLLNSLPLLNPSFPFLIITIIIILQFLPLTLPFHSNLLPSPSLLLPNQSLHYSFCFPSLPIAFLLRRRT